MTRPQKSNSLRDAERRKLSTWIPPNGDGIGLWKGRRTYFVNGTPQLSKSGLTINRNPVHDSARNIVRGLLVGTVKGAGKLAIQGAKDIYGGTKNTSNALLGMASPWNLAAMGRTRKNLAQLGVKPPKKQSKEVLERIAQNQAKLLTEGFGTRIEAKKAINKDKEEVKEVIKKETNPELNVQAQNLSNVIDNNQAKNNAGMPTEDNVVETPPPEKTTYKGRTRWVGKNTTWVDRSGNVIAPKENSELDFKQRRNMFQLTEEERKKIIMTSLEQEMYW